MTFPQPRWDSIWLACRGCGHEWDDWSPAIVPVETLVAHWQSYRCPSCGCGYEDHTIMLRATALKGATDG